MEIPELGELSEEYRSLDQRLNELGDKDPATLLVKFPLAAHSVEPLRKKVTCSYEELTAYCPWTKFPDQGKVFVEYDPHQYLLELKSFKFYMLAFRDRHITQEHLAQKMYDDLWKFLDPMRLSIELDYMPRGGLHTIFRLNS